MSLREKRCPECRGAGYDYYHCTQPCPTCGDASGVAVLQREAGSAGQERDDELVEADALFSGDVDEAGVQGARESDYELAAGFHAPDSTTCSIDNTSTACDTTDMSIHAPGPKKLGQDVKVGDVLLGLSNEPRLVTRVEPYTHPTVAGAVAIAYSEKHPGEDKPWGISLWHNHPVRVMA